MNSVSRRHFHEKNWHWDATRSDSKLHLNLLQLLSLWKCVNILPLTPLYGRYGTPPQYLEILEGLNYQNTLFTDKLVKRHFCLKYYAFFLSVAIKWNVCEFTDIRNSFWEQKAGIKVSPKGICQLKISSCYHYQI